MSSKPRIAVDARALVDEPAGVGYYTRALLLALARRGNVGLTALSHRAARDVAELTEAGVAFETLQAPFGYWWQQKTLPRRLRGGAFDLLWSPLATLPQETPLPAVVTIHDLTPLLYPYWHSWRNRWTFRRRLPATLRSAARIVAVSEATARDVEHRFPAAAQRLDVVPNGVDSVFVPATDSQVEAIRRSFDAPRGYVLCVGTLEPRKNLARLLDAWRLVVERLDDPPPLLVAGGRGWRSRGLRRRLRRTPGARYLGRLPRPRLVEALQAATVFAYPSLYEGFGLPVAEAMACGVPVVTSDRSSLPAVVGDCGVLVNPQHTQELATAIAGLLGDATRRRELGQRAVRRAERYSWETAAANMEDVFSLALAGRRGPRAGGRE
jgi:glycosyltransferase involved in cell wall biosynthesis